jgi:hypothetical protein
MNETPAAAPLAWLMKLGEAWAVLRHDLAGSWRYALARDARECIDDATLRDLGLHRSELASYCAELDGHAPATRRRVIAQRGSGL